MTQLIALALLTLVSIPAHADSTSMSVGLCPQGAENTASRFIAHSLTVNGAKVNQFEQDATRTFEVMINGASGDVTLSTASQDILLGHISTMPSREDSCQTYPIHPASTLEFSARTRHGIPFPSLNPENFGTLERSRTDFLKILQPGSPAVRLIGETTQALRHGEWQ